MFTLNFLFDAMIGGYFFEHGNVCSMFVGFFAKVINLVFSAVLRINRFCFLKYGLNIALNTYW